MNETQFLYMFHEVSELHVTACLRVYVSDFTCWKESSNSVFLETVILMCWGIASCWEKQKQKKQKKGNMCFQLWHNTCQISTHLPPSLNHLLVLINIHYSYSDSYYYLYCLYLTHCILHSVLMFTVSSVYSSSIVCTFIH